VLDGGGKPRVSALDRDAGAVLDDRLDEGGPATLRTLADGEAIVDKSFASATGSRSATGPLPHPDRRGPASSRRRVRRQGRLLGSAIVTQRLMARDFDQTDDAIDFVKLAPGRRRGDGPGALASTMTALPDAEVRNQQELKETRKNRSTSCSADLRAARAGVIVSLFGIANTLALSIHERTRELGMLRAIGMSRRQVRTMIRYEAVITALIGAILGMVLGVIFAALIAQPLKDEGFTLSYPVGSLIVLLVFAALAGVSPRSRPPAAPRASTCWSRCSTSEPSQPRRRRRRTAPSAPRFAPAARASGADHAVRAWSASSSSATLSSAAWIAVTWVTTSMQ
jgi:putative ABC transport system permease protein